MNQTFLRPIRIVVAILVLIISSLIFIDIKEKIPVHYFDYILYPQFVPSLLNFINTVSWIATGFILVSLFSFLFGRIYCSFLCPLGIFQDIISYLSGKLKFIKPFLKENIVISVRRSKGVDINAACGQLYYNSLNELN